jgi:hypothetical protein
MGYLISAGAGLAVGLVILVWALRLRSKLAAAEKKALEADAARLEAVRIAGQNAQAAHNAEQATIRVERQLDGLRNQLKETQRRLAQSGNPTAVKAWLDAELGKETV